MRTIGVSSIPAPPDAATLCELQALLADERARRESVQAELDLRNCALGTTSTHFIIIDARGAQWSIVYVNRAVIDSFGYQLEELLGRDPMMLVSESDNTKEAYDEFVALTRTGVAVKAELIARRKDRSKFSVGFVVTPVRDAGGAVTHYLSIGADITARLEQERARQQLQERLLQEMKEREQMAIELRLAQKLESVGRLAAGVAHEINTPIQYVGDSVSFLQSAQGDLLNVLTAYRDGLRRLANGEQAQTVLPQIEAAESALDTGFLIQEIPKAFERTLEGVDRVTSIVCAMKEFAHPDSTEHCAADINHAIQTTLLVARNEYKYHASVQTRFADLPQLTCNIGELNQVFLNLLVNAAHAIAESGKTAQDGLITIGTALAGTDVEITITDNGCGIPESHLEKIFDPFFTTKPVGRGTGQGLAIARSIVTDKHGGQLAVRSTAGVGTSFIIRLPVAGRPARQA